MRKQPDEKVTNVHDTCQSPNTVWFKFRNPVFDPWQDGITVFARVADRFPACCYDPSLNRVVDLATGRMRFAAD